MASEEGVVAEAQSSTVGDREDDGLEPGHAALWQRDKDDVVATGIEGFLNLQDLLEDMRSIQYKYFLYWKSGVGHPLLLKAWK